MDREPEELQFLGSFGIYREAYKILVSSKKLFTQITLTLIFPVAFFSLVQIYLSDHLVSKIYNNSNDLYAPSLDEGFITDKILSNLLSEWILLFLLSAVYLLFVIIFSLLSTSAVVYTIACLYTARKITINKILDVIPRVWIRLMITLLWNFLILVGFNTATMIVIVLLIILAPTPVKVVLLVIVFILFFVGIVYITIICQLGAVISVLEDIYGIEAIQKGRKLIKGKRGTAGFIFVKFQLATGFVYGISGVHGDSYTVIAKMGHGILFLLLLSLLFLLNMIIQTVIYFVCKSYHHENIDKSRLWDHLQVYDSEYVPVIGKTFNQSTLFDFYVCH